MDIRVEQLKILERGASYFWTTCIILTVSLRYALSSRLPAMLYPDMPHDDGWVFTKAMSIMNGHWLGSYDHFTLIKGPFSPFFMAISSYLGIAFTDANTILYICACLFFINAIRPIIKNRLSLFLMLLVLLFNPITFGFDTGQRIYRNGMGQWQILFILSSMIGIYLRRNSTWMTNKWFAIVGGLCFGAFILTREDSLWLYPFVWVSSIVTALALYFDRNRNKTSYLTPFVPILISYTVVFCFSVVNYVYYGKFLINDRSGGAYALVAADLYAIAPNADDEKLYTSEVYKDQYISIYKSTMEKAFSVSPTLNLAANEIRTAIDAWGGWGNNKTGQLFTDHMLFALRDGVFLYGLYKNLEETEAYYEKVHAELQAAFKQGKLTKRGFTLSPLIKPADYNTIKNALNILPNSVLGIVSFEHTEARILPSIGQVKNIEKMGLILGEEFLIDEKFLQGSGWIFSSNNSDSIYVKVTDREGNEKSRIRLLDSPDVYLHFNNKYENAKNARFSFLLADADTDTGLFLSVFKDSGSVIAKFPIGDKPTCGNVDDLIYYCIDNIFNSNTKNDFYTKVANKSNFVTNLYQKYGTHFASLALIFYLVATIKVIKNAFLRKKSNLFHIWLLSTGVGCTFIGFMGIMSIITASSFDALTILYAAPAYLLVIVLVCLCLGYLLEIMILSFRKRDNV